jgi:hypothetical protein
MKGVLVGMCVGANPSRVQLLMSIVKVSLTERCDTVEL